MNVEKSDENYTNRNNFYSLNFFANILHESFPVIKSFNDFVYHTNLDEEIEKQTKKPKNQKPNKKHKIFKEDKD